MSAGFILYSKNGVWFRSKAINCLRLYTGNVIAEVVYPNSFVSGSYENTIKIYRKNSSGIGGKREDGPSVIDISSNNYETLEAIINNSQVEPGPKYEKFSLNGYVAAFYHIDDELGIWDIYKIPFGDRVVEVDYRPSILTNDERLLAEKMLKSLTLTQVKEDVAKAVVENCGK